MVKQESDLQAMRMGHLDSQDASSSTGMDELAIEESLQGFEDESWAGKARRYFHSKETPAPPTMGNYRRMFVGFCVLALITFPLNVVLQNESGSYACSTDDVVRERVGNDVLGAMSVVLFKEMSISFFFRTWLQVNHPEATIRFAVPVAQLELGTADIDGDAVIVDGAVDWYTRSVENRKEMLTACVRTMKLQLGIYATFEAACFRHNLTLNEPYHLKQSELDLAKNGFANNSVIEAVVQEMNITVPFLLQHNINFTLPNRIWCNLASYNKAEYQTVNRICTNLDAIPRVADSLGKSIAVKCLPRVHFEGVRWFAIFSLKTMFSIFLSGAIISLAAITSSGTGGARRRKSTVMF
eukprot:TRINITY_DN67162_c5_g1_i2.p1 TRINITY_DN67162_c5_g1~~TRINITY_DN67162_c5_g1_i2.p1  ORF type:complete len:354 (+),score=157.48 TRINITY_DN67162_c5_g1_i2:729-1790(+)